MLNGRILSKPRLAVFAVKIFLYLNYEEDKRLKDN